MNLRLAVYLIIALVVIVVLGYFYRKSVTLKSEKTVKSATPRFVGGKTCAECHKAEYDLWRGSHHDLAMQEANKQTVLGNFENAGFDYYGIKSEFYKRDGKYIVRTDGPDGELKEYEIKYTFGVYPLQQYLIELPGGRLQALGIAWDSRPRKEGGQRWFHLYPSEKVTHTDTLHWTGIDQNWNFMCAECHSTDLKKNYELGTDSYNTTWAEINVSCEACHGPGSEHVKLAEQKNLDKSPDMELAINFNESKDVKWVIDEETGNAVRSEPLQSHKEITACSRCHSRRSEISDNYIYGRNLLDTHIPSLLDEGVYYPDGQIEAEDYEWGSFMQSRMYTKGVTCTDCHNPHSLKLKAEGNALCAGCHQAEKYDTPSHHHHKPFSSGSQCVACHMPETSYMVIDARRDHSIRIPRPDLSDNIGTPNACNKCHTDRSSEWAANEFTSWGGRKNKGFQTYGETLYEARNGAVDAEKLLVKLADDENAPSIARATALAELAGYLSPASIESVKIGLASDDPLIRGAALDALQPAPPDVKLKLAYGMVADPVLAVRMKAVSVLAGVPKEEMTAAQREGFDKAVSEYVSSQMTNADRPEAHLNVGLIYTETGKTSEAEAQYQIAMKLDPSFIPAYVNLADLYRIEERDNEAESLLRSALGISPWNGDVYHALGLLLVRQNRIPEAMNALEESVKLSPGNTRYSYVYAVALNDMGKKDESIRVLEKAHKNRPAERQILYALINFKSDFGDITGAYSYAVKLVQLSPEDPEAIRILHKLKERMNRQ